MHGLMFTAGVVALASILIGLARFGAWLIDRREEAATKVIRDRVRVIESRAELRTLEIEASKRGDLHEAARWADLDESRQ